MQQVEKSAHAELVIPKFLYILKIMRFIILMTIIFQITSCSLTPLELENLESKKAYYYSGNGDIIVNKKIHSPSFFANQYQAKEVFKDNEKSQQLLVKSNEYQQKSYQWFGTGIYLSAVWFVITERLAPKYKGLFLWVFAGVSIFPPIHFKMQAHEAVEEAVRNYNEPSPDIAFTFSF